MISRDETSKKNSGGPVRRTYEERKNQLQRIKLEDQKKQYQHDTSHLTNELQFFSPAKHSDEQKNRRERLNQKRKNYIEANQISNDIEDFKIPEQSDQVVIHFGNRDIKKAMNLFGGMAIHQTVNLVDQEKMDVVRELNLI